MKRRSFLKAMGMTAGGLVGASCAPKGASEMPGRFGDILSKLALGQQLTSGEIERLRLLGNQQQGIVSQMGTMLTPNGNLDPNIFSHHSSEFSMLPHETASMYSGTAQSIPHADYTTVVYEADSALDADELRLSWAEGIGRNPATGEFSLKGVPESTIWCFFYTLWWHGTPDYTRVLIVEKDTAIGVANSHDDGTSIHRMQQGSVMMRARKASTSWVLQVSQESGAALDLDGALFQVVRLR